MALSPCMSSWWDMSEVDIVVSMVVAETVASAVVVNAATSALLLTDTFTSRRQGSGVARVRQALAGRRSISGRLAAMFSAKTWRIQLVGVGQRSGGWAEPLRS